MTVILNIDSDVTFYSFCYSNVYCQILTLTKNCVNCFSHLLKLIYKISLKICSIVRKLAYFFKIFSNILSEFRKRNWFPYTWHPDFLKTYKRNYLLSIRYHIQAMSASWLGGFVEPFPLLYRRTVEVSQTTRPREKMKKHFLKFYYNYVIKFIR